MTAPAAPFPKALVVAALALHAAYALVACFIAPAMNSDSATGFYVWDCWRTGAPWNHMVVPDPADLSRDTSFFQAWWSPGQYLVTAPWQLLGLSLGHSIALGGFVAATAALLGFWHLYRTFGFDDTVAGWSVLAIACNWTMARTYGDYMGGETAVLAVLPWLVLATQRALDASWFSWIAVPVLCWIGAMAKNSYVPVGAGLIAGFRGLRLSGRPWLEAAKFVELVRWAGWFSVGYFAFWATYLRHGSTPGLGLGGPVHPDWWTTALRVIAYPVSAIFSVGNLLGRVFQHPSHPLVAHVRDLWPIHLIIALGAAATFVWLLKREFSQRSAWARLVLGVVASNLVFYGLLLLWRTPEGLEERFFKPVAFLVLPSLVATFTDGRPRWAGRVLCGLLVFSSLYGVASFANRARYLVNLDNVGNRGITQHVLSREGLSILHALDTALPERSVVVVPSPEMVLELKHVRRLPTHAVMMEPKQLAAERRHGRAENLVVIADAKMLANGRARAFLDSFADYPADKWNVHRYGEWFFFHQGPYVQWPAQPGAP